MLLIGLCRRRGRGRDAWGPRLGGGEQARERRAGIGFGHETFANQERAVAAAARAELRGGDPMWKACLATRRLFLRLAARGFALRCNMQIKYIFDFRRWHDAMQNKEQTCKLNRYNNFKFEISGMSA